MQTRPLLSASRQRGIGDWLVIIFSVLLVLLGAAIFGLGIWLTALGGSWYWLSGGRRLDVGWFADGSVALSGDPRGHLDLGVLGGRRRRLGSCFLGWSHLQCLGSLPCCASLSYGGTSRPTVDVALWPRVRYS